MINYSSKNIASLHAKLFILHDEQKWSELESTANELFKMLGYHESNSIRASKFVPDAYKFSDDAVEAQKKQDYKGEREAYRKVMTSLYKVHQSLKTETKSVPYKVKWYYAARHKKLISFAFNVFVSHLKRFNYTRPLTAFKAAYIAISKIYPAHYQKSNSLLEEALEQYWDTIMSGRNKLPLPVEF